jgi:hypothetical protein
VKSLVAKILLLSVLLAFLYSFLHNARIYDKILKEKLFTIELEIEVFNRPYVGAFGGVSLEADFTAKDPELTDDIAQIFFLPVGPSKQILSLSNIYSQKGIKELRLRAFNDLDFPILNIKKITLNINRLSSLFKQETIAKKSVALPFSQRLIKNKLYLSDLPNTEDLFKEYKIDEDLAKYRLIRAILNLITLMLLLLIAKLAAGIFGFEFGLRVLWLGLYKVKSRLSAILETQIALARLLANFKNQIKIQWQELAVSAVNLGIIRFCLPLILIGLLGLVGRFDWVKGAYEYSLRSYLVSVYFFVLIVPLIYFVSFRVFQVQRLAFFITLFFVVILSLPYRWLGLEKYYFSPQFEPNFQDWRAPGLLSPVINWLPQALSSSPVIPGELTFFGLTFIAVGLLLFGFFKLLRNCRKDILLSPQKSTILLFAIIIIFIGIQTWLHLSMRSPYTYLPHFEQATDANYWWHVYLFPQGQGAVNLDYSIYRNSELLFLGALHEVSVLSGRVFPMYISAQGSAFFNPYYVWLILNLIAWFGSVIAIYFLTKELLKKHNDVNLIASIAAFFMATAQGMIVYVAQPKPYVVAIAGVAMLSCSYVYLFKNKVNQLLHSLIFATMLALYLLSYNAEPWLPALLLVSVFLGYSLFYTAFAISFAVFIYKGFAILAVYVGNLKQADALADAGGHPLANIIEHLKCFDLMSLTYLSIKNPFEFTHTMLHAFNFALGLAVVGFLQLKEKPQKRFILSLILPAYLTYSLMHYGESFYIEFPRLVYSVYPAIFLLTAFGLVTVGNRLTVTGWPMWGKYLPWVVVLGTAVLANLDVFGFPGIYFYWFYMRAMP